MLTAPLDNVLTLPMPQIPDRPPWNLVIRPAASPRWHAVTTVRGAFDELAKYAVSRDAAYQAIQRFIAMIHNANGFRDEAAFPIPDWEYPDSSVATQPYSVVRTAARRAVKTDHRWMTRIMLAYMLRMVEQQRFGLVHWLSDTVCKYYFFRKRTVEHRTPFLTEKKKKERVRVELIDYQALHVHDVMDAKTTPLSQFTGHIPQQFKQAVDSTPEWLKKALEVVDGHQIGSTVREREVNRTVWEEAVPVARPVSQWDPAIVYGPFVICGWDATER